MEKIESLEVANLCKLGVKGCETEWVPLDDCAFSDVNEAYCEWLDHGGEEDEFDPEMWGFAQRKRQIGTHNEIKIAIPQATKQGYIECELGGWWT